MEEIIRFLKQLFERFVQAEVLGLSAQLAYFFLLSLFPFLMFIVTLIGYLPFDDRMVIAVLAEYLPEDVVFMIDENLKEIMNNRSGGLLSISIIGTLWSASNGFNAITRSFNKAYGVKPARNFILNRIIAIGLMFSMVAAIIIALLFPVFGRLIGEYVLVNVPLPETIVDMWDVLRWVSSSVMFFVVFFVLYRLAPNKKMNENHVLYGTIFATVGWQLTSYGFSYYVETLGNYSLTYGSLGTVIVLMIWFYLSGIIITTGGVINAHFSERRQEK